MVLKKLLRSAAVALLLLPAAGLSADPPPEPPAAGAVNLPLSDYLALVEKVERLDRERAGETAHREAPVAEVVAQRTRVTVGPVGTASLEMEAEIAARYEALVQGHPQAPLLLPWNGFAAQIEVHSLAGTAGVGAAVGGAAAKSGRGVLLVTPVPGRYAVEVRGRAALTDRGGVRRLTLAPVAAPVAEVEVDLPADLAWSAPGAVAVEETVAAGRRAVRLAVRRGEAPVLEIQRHLPGSEAAKLLAQSVVLTLFQLRPDGLRRHDVVLYEVSRGGLGSLAVDLPADLAVEQVATDEGDVVPVVEARHLTVHRKRQLQGVGYLVLTSTPRPEAALPVRAVVPASTPGAEVEVRARYLVVASSVAADVQPQPAASWLRVDLSDLPKVLGEALQTLDLSAAWRLVAPASPASPPLSPSLAIALLPASPRLPTVVRQRETTTLLTVDGTVLHRDRFTLDQAGAALDLTLPAGAVLWSVKVGEQAVRPVERGGTLSIPLGFLAGSPQEDLVVEVVSVLERQIPRGRSQLALDLPQVAAPVVEHQWRLLLPEGARYRFRNGALQPVGASAPSAPSAPSSRPPSVTYSDHGPGGSAGLRLRVVDDKGAAIPGATVTLRSPALAHPVVAVTNAQGSAIVPELPPGFYTVEAQLEGFSSVEYPKFELPAGKMAQLEITLQPAVDETITVTAEAPMLDERRLSSGMTFSNRDQRRISTGATVTPKELAKIPTARDPYEVLSKDLQQGLVGGVKPLPVAIPESGKALLLSGALPPAKVGVELDVKGKG